MTKIVDRSLAIIRELQQRDFFTAAHTWRVVSYARAVAEVAGMERAFVDRYAVAAAVHDVGKLDVPREILRKPGRLTEAEFAVVKTHPVRGWERLRLLGFEDQAALDLVRHHHERWDGLGYPDGLRGGEIPLGARFFAAIDAFDALTSVRPYRREVGPEAAERALGELHAGTRTRYCPEAVELFEQVYRSGVVDWVLRHFNEAGDVPALSVEGLGGAD